jgi:hypothetical protein
LVELSDCVGYSTTGMWRSVPGGNYFDIRTKLIVHSSSPQRWSQWATAWTLRSGRLGGYGAAPKDLAPNLYRQTHYKYRTVHKELQNLNWIKNLRSLNTQELLDEFFLLFAAVSEVSLSEGRDTIIWCWTRSGEYSTTSAYEAQFLGANSAFKASSIWRAKTEPKCRFFAWLAAHGKAPTADNLAKKGWPCNPTCVLCYCVPETNENLDQWEPSYGMQLHGGDMEQGCPSLPATPGYYTISERWNIRLAKSYHTYWIHGTAASKCRHYVLLLVVCLEGA